MFILKGQQLLRFERKTNSLLVESSNVVRAGETSGKIEIDLKKSSPGRWPSLGSPLENHLRFGPQKIGLWRLGGIGR